MAEEGLKLYLISQTVNKTDDTYDNCVVCARNADDAKLIHPIVGDWDPNHECKGQYCRYNDWVCSVNDINCEYIGIAAPGMERGVVCASFITG